MLVSELVCSRIRASAGFFGGACSNDYWPGVQSPAPLTERVCERRSAKVWLQSVDSLRPLCKHTCRSRCPYIQFLAHHRYSINSYIHTMEVGLTFPEALTSRHPWHRRPSIHNTRNEPLPTLFSPTLPSQIWQLIAFAAFHCTRPWVLLNNVTGGRNSSLFLVSILSFLPKVTTLD